MFYTRFRIQFAIKKCCRIKCCFFLQSMQLATDILITHSSALYRFQSTAFFFYWNPVLVLSEDTRRRSLQCLIVPLSVFWTYSIKKFCRQYCSGCAPEIRCWCTCDTLDWKARKTFLPRLADPTRPLWQSVTCVLVARYWARFDVYTMTMEASPIHCYWWFSIIIVTLWRNSWRTWSW